MKNWSDIQTTLELGTESQKVLYVFSYFTLFWGGKRKTTTTTKNHHLQSTQSKTWRPPQKFLRNVLWEEQGPLLFVRLREEEGNVTGMLTRPLSPVLPFSLVDHRVGRIVFLLYNVDHLLYLMLSSMFFLSTGNKQSLKNKQPRKG